MLPREYLDKLNPDLLKMLETYGDNLGSKFKCHRVGTITKFDPQRLVVNIRLLDKMTFRDMVDDYTELVDIPIIINGIDDSHLTFGDITGSECLVHFNDTDIDLWHETGEAYEPNTARIHDWNDGFAELRPYSTPHLFNYDLAGTVLERKNCKVRLLDNGAIEITNGSAIMTLSGNNVDITANTHIAGNVTIDGDVTINGKVTIMDDVTIQGDTNQTGQIMATGTITSNTDVRALAISLLTHIHGAVMPGNGTTGAPQ